MIERFFSPDSVIMDLQSSDRDEVLAELTESLVSQNPFISRNEVYNSLVLREEKKSTLVMDGIAVPHVKAEGTGKTTITLGLSRDKVDFDLTGENKDSSARVIFAVVFDENNSYDHLNVLKDIMDIIQKKDFLDTVLGFNTPEEVCRYICGLR